MYDRDQAQALRMRMGADTRQGSSRFLHCLFYVMGDTQQS